MHHYKKGTLLMLDSNRHHLPAQASISSKSAAGAPVSGVVDEADVKKGHKKHKQAKYRAEVKGELAGLADALHQLRGRVSNLHALHLQRDGEGTALANRLDALGEEQARARDLAGSLEARVSALRTKVDAVAAETAVIADTLADVAVQPDRDTALFSLEDRIEEAEKTLANLREWVGEGPEGPADDLTQRIDALDQTLTIQAERLAGLEGSPSREGPDDGSLARLEQALLALGSSVDERVAALERDLSTLRDQNRRWRESERTWAEGQLGGLRRGLGFGMGLLALLLLAGFVATWWHGERQLDLIAARVAAVEQGSEARFAALTVSGRQGDEALGDVAAQLGAAMQNIEATNAKLAELFTQPAPVAAPREAQLADLLARLGALEQAGAAPRPVPTVGSITDVEQGSAAPENVAVAPKEASAEAGTVPAQGLLPAAPAAPVESGLNVESVPASGLTEEDQTPPAAPAGAAVAAPSVPPARASEPVAVPQRYVLQLIGFRSQASIAPFADKYGVAGATRWERVTRGGRPWYRVLFGDYADRREAEAALAELPTELRRLSPLVRPLPDGVQRLVAD